MVRLGSIGEIDDLFTDRMPVESVMEALSASDVELHVADTAGGPFAPSRETPEEPWDDRSP